MRDFAVGAALAEIHVGVFRDDAVPEADRCGIAGLLGDDPFAGEAREQVHRGAAAGAADLHLWA